LFYNWTAVIVSFVMTSFRYLPNSFTFSLQCRSGSSTTKTQKYCLLTKQTLRELKKTITQVHTQRRDWNTLDYDKQIDFITSLRSKLTLLGKRMRLVAKHLRKAMRSKGKRSWTRLV